MRGGGSHCKPMTRAGGSVVRACVYLCLWSGGMAGGLFQEDSPQGFSVKDLALIGPVRNGSSLTHRYMACLCAHFKQLRHRCLTGQCPEQSCITLTSATCVWPAYPVKFVDVFDFNDWVLNEPLAVRCGAQRIPCLSIEKHFIHDCIDFSRLEINVCCPCRQCV